MNLKGLQVYSGLSRQRGTVTFHIVDDLSKLPPAVYDLRSFVLTGEDHLKRYMIEASARYDVLAQIANLVLSPVTATPDLPPGFEDARQERERERREGCSYEVY